MIERLCEGDLERLLGQKIKAVALTRQWFKIVLEDDTVVEFSATSSALPLLSIIRPELQTCH